MKMKILAILLCVVMGLISMAVPTLADASNANIKIAGETGGAILYSAANEWFVTVPCAGTVTVSDNKRSYDFPFEDEGTYSLGLQKIYTGQLKLGGFVPVDNDVTYTITFYDVDRESVIYTGFITPGEPLFAAYMADRVIGYGSENYCETALRALYNDRGYAEFSGYFWDWFNEDGNIMTAGDWERTDVSSDLNFYLSINTPIVVPEYATVIFWLDDVDGEEWNRQTLEIGVDLMANPGDPAKDGYIFLGWLDNSGELIGDWAWSVPVTHFQPFIYYIAAWEEIVVPPMSPYTVNPDGSITINIPGRYPEFVLGKNAPYVYRVNKNKSVEDYNSQAYRGGELLAGDVLYLVRNTDGD